MPRLKKCVEKECQLIELASEIYRRRGSDYPVSLRKPIAGISDMITSCASYLVSQGRRKESNVRHYLGAGCTEYPVAVAIASLLYTIQSNTAPERLETLHAKWKQTADLTTKEQEEVIRITSWLLDNIPFYYGYKDREAKDGHRVAHPYAIAAVRSIREAMAPRARYPRQCWVVCTTEFEHKIPSDGDYIHRLAVEYCRYFFWMNDSLTAAKLEAHMRGLRHKGKLYSERSLRDTLGFLRKHQEYILDPDISPHVATERFVERATATKNGRRHLYFMKPQAD